MTQKLADATKRATGPRRTDRWSRTGDAVSLVRRTPPPRFVRFTAEPEAIEVDLAASALLVVDMQNDFLHPDGWFAGTRGVDVSPLHAPVPAINALAGAFRAKGAAVVHVNWGVRSDVANLPANVLDKGSGCGERPGYGDAGVRGRVLVAGDWGAQSAAGIEVAPGDIIVRKHRLSGFRDNELDQILRRLGVTTLFYAGVNLDRCVFATLTDGAFAGYDSVLVTDACATVSPAYVGEAVLYLVRLLYGFTTTSADLLSALAAPAAPPAS